jgi:hypothetical protein
MNADSEDPYSDAALDARFAAAWQLLTADERKAERDKFRAAIANPVVPQKTHAAAQLHAVTPARRGRPSCPFTSITQWDRAILAEAARRITGDAKVRVHHCVVVAEIVGDDTFRTTWDEAKRRTMTRTPGHVLARMLPDQVQGPQRWQEFAAAVRKHARERRGRPRRT